METQPGGTGPQVPGQVMGGPAHSMPGERQKGATVAPEMGSCVQQVEGQAAQGPASAPVSVPVSAPASPAEWELEQAKAPMSEASAQGRRERLMIRW